MTGGTPFSYLGAQAASLHERFLLPADDGSIESLINTVY